MRTGFFAFNLRAEHVMAFVSMLCDAFRFQRFSETGPAASGIKFIQGAEQRFAGNNIHVDALLLMVPVFIVEGRLRSVVLGYFILDFSQLFLK